MISCQTMVIRRYRQTDLPQIVRLFYDTVHIINASDYTQKQLDAWATGEADMAMWDMTLGAHVTYVVAEEDVVLGFGDITADGYLDRLYVHHEFQRRGIATAICQRLESECGACTLTVHASITALPFFQKRGYRLVREQQVERHGVLLTNFVMTKALR